MCKIRVRFKCMAILNLLRGDFGSKLNKSGKELNIEKPL